MGMPSDSGGGGDVPPKCPEQKRLKDAVINAIQEKYKAQEQLDKARRTGQPDGQLAFLLSTAKNAQRKAERHLYRHVEQHGCEE